MAARAVAALAERAQRRLRGLPLRLDRHSLAIYLLGGVPMFIAMSSVYWSAQFIPSGWISVIFGFSPIMTSLLATLLLGERAFADGRLGGYGGGLWRKQRLLALEQGQSTLA